MARVLRVPVAVVEVVDVVAVLHGLMPAVLAVHVIVIGLVVMLVLFVLVVIGGRRHLALVLSSPRSPCQRRVNRSTELKASAQRVDPRAFGQRRFGMLGC
jgi:hypothetical protein